MDTILLTILFLLLVVVAVRRAFRVGLDGSVDTATTDTSTTSPNIVAHNSSRELLKLIWKGVAMTAASGVLAFGDLSGPFPPILMTTVGSIGFIFFGGVTLLICYRCICRGGETVISVNTDGLRDTRICSDVIPWTAIRTVRGFRIRNFRTTKTDALLGFFLVLDEAQRANLHLTLRAKLDEMFGPKGLYINMAGLDAEPEELLKAVRARAGR